MSASPSAFIQAHLHLAEVPFVPELRLFQAEEPIGLWELTEGEYRSDQPPPFWAFPWAGGTALARYVLDTPALVAGKVVLDLAAGSGLVAIAAVKAGAASVTAVEIDPVAIAAIDLNAGANDVTIATTLGDILDSPVEAEVILAGDVFYSQAMSDRMLRFLRRARRAGADVLVGDPGRAFLDRSHFDLVATYEIPVRYELESARTKQTTVLRLR